MKVLLFSGDHSRHVYVHEHLLKRFNVCGAVVMEREPVLLNESIKGSSDNITQWPKEDQKIYKEHFKKRKEVEDRYYGNKSTDLYDSYCDVIKVSPENLNSKEVIDFVVRKNPDLCFIFGVNLIKGDLAKILPYWKINLHLGLSPWYRGSATLFWPFYNLQPQFAGSTFHQIVDEPDAGNILHQTVPVLEMGDTMHEVAAKTVVSSAKDAVTLLDHIAENNVIAVHKQKGTGKNYLIRDFEPHNLRAIYNLYDDKIVDEWLHGRLGKRLPKLVRGF